MANPYGWSDQLEEIIFSNEASSDHLREAYKAIAETEGDAAVQAWATLDWASLQLSYVGSDASPADYQQVLDVLPQGYLDPDIDRRIRAFASSNSTNGDADLWRAATEALAHLTSSLWSDVVAIMGPKVKAWRDSEIANGRAATSGGGAASNDNDGGDFYANVGEDNDNDEGGGAADPPPDTLDECWEHAAWGPRFRSWAEDKPIASDVAFCDAVEQKFVASPSWPAALEIFATFLENGAPSTAYVEPATVEDIRKQLPSTDEEFAADPPGDLFLAAHGESAKVLEQWYGSFVADMQAAPAAAETPYN